jgi:Outer membrane protein
MKKLIFSILLTAGCQGAMAQMTLNDCLVYARDHAPRNMINGIAVRQAESDSRIAAAGLMPSLGLSSDGNLSFGRSIDPETNTYDNRKTLYTGFGLQLSLPLFDGLVSVNNLKAAKTGRLRQEEASRIEADNISLEVIRSFYNVSYCKAMVAQMQEQLERDLRNLKATELGLDLGTKSGADVAEIEAIVASDRYELTNQRNLLSKAYLKLRSVMGMEPDDSELELTEEEYVGEPDAGFVHPRIAEARLGLKQSRYNLRSARGAFSPVISLNAGVSTSYYRIFGSDGVNRRFSQQWHDNMGQYIGFSVYFPIFSGLSRVNGLKKAKLEVKRREALLEEARLATEREKREARLDFYAAAEELEAAKARVMAEETAYKAVQRKFELGDASAIDLYTSGAKLATARANREGKRIQKIISRILLGYYNGEKLIK